jgi:hypothetical protein
MTDVLSDEQVIGLAGPHRLLPIVSFFESWNGSLVGSSDAQSTFTKASIARRIASGRIGQAAQLRGSWRRSTSALPASKGGDVSNGLVPAPATPRPDLAQWNEIR